jgi:hypothetical protein
MKGSGWNRHAVPPRHFAQAGWLRLVKVQEINLKPKKYLILDDDNWPSSPSTRYMVL